MATALGCFKTVLEKKIHPRDITIARAFFLEEVQLHAAQLLKLVFCAFEERVECSVKLQRF